MANTINKEFDNKDNIDKYKKSSNYKNSLDKFKTKKQIIDEINYNFRTILSYGTANELIPNGQFIVKDIVIDEDTNSQNIILEQTDNPSISLILPRSTFVKFIKTALKNSKDLNLPEGALQYSTDTLEKCSSLKVLLDHTLTDLQEIQVLPLEENNIILLRDGKPEISNYSICPIYTEPLQKYLVRERTPDFTPSKPDNKNTLKNLKPNYQIEDTNEEEPEKEPEIPDIIIEPGPKIPEIEIEMDM